MARSKSKQKHMKVRRKQQHRAKLKREKIALKSKPGRRPVVTSV